MTNRHILLIDDEEDVRFTLGEGLKRAGFDVTVANGGHDGLEALNKRPFDLVVTDILMEDGEGVETILTIRADHGDIPVIAISGQPQYLNILSRLGVDETIEKPFRLATLVEAVNRHLA